MKQILCCAVIVFWARFCAEDGGTRFIVWNVGQGAWSTLVQSGRCFHIDMGGTKFLFGEKLKLLCGRKQNFIFITHFDSDHINLVARARFYLPRVCRATPIDHSVSFRKRRWLETVEDCQTPAGSPVRKILAAHFQNRNDSNIYLVDKRILVTGDAPKKLEKRILEFPELTQVTYFLLGHHGSRTSSSFELLRRLPHLRAGIASSEKSKYGHPHDETIGRLRKLGVPILTTELQGTVFISLD